MPEPGPAATDSPGESAGAGARLLERVGTAALLAIPGGLIVYFGFNAGGFFPGAPAFAALVLAQVLALRTVLAEDPFAGFSRGVALAAGALAAYAGWVLASALWSDATARALIEFDRALLYLLALVLFGSMVWSEERIRWALRGVALAVLVVCGTGLVSRVLPEVLPTAAGYANSRLSYPVTYWNTLGLLATFGILLCFHFASRIREPLPLRVLGAAVVPALGATLLLTFSRGAIVVGIVGIVVYVAVARPRGLLSAVLACGAPTTVAVVAAYRADLLATDDPTTPAAVAQGHDLALLLGACMLGAALLRLVLGLFLDPRLARFSLSPRSRRRAMTVGPAAGGLVAVVLVLALGVPHEVSNQYDRFVHSNDPQGSGPTRARLANPAAEGRIDQWDVALDALADDPLHGQGAGTYQVYASQHRINDEIVTDAHSLYIESLAELGIVGLALLLVVLVAILVGFARRALGMARATHGILLAAGVAWGLRTGLDWDWEMPVVTAWLFALGGLALARSARGTRVWADALARSRTLIALGWLVVGVTPGLIAISQGRLETGAEALKADDCARATDRALSSLSLLAVRPEPYAIVGFCDMREGRHRAAMAAMQKAVQRDPDNWEYRYGLALADAAVGVDARRDTAHALRLNPREPLVRELSTHVREDDRRELQRLAPRLAERALAARRLTVSTL